jgi:hypothetical protein
MIHDHSFVTAPKSGGMCVQRVGYNENQRLCGLPASHHGELHQKVADHPYQVGSPSYECGYTYPTEGHGSGLKCNRPANQHQEVGTCSHGRRQDCRDIDCQHCIGNSCPMNH